MSNVIDLDAKRSDADAKRAAKNAKRREQRAAKKAQPETDPGFRPIMHPFRVNTKRHACYQLLNRSRGATVEEGVAATGWAANVVLSEYYEIAKACGARVGRMGGHYHLTGGRR